MKRSTSYTEYGIDDMDFGLKPSTWECVSAHPFKLLLLLSATYVAGAIIGKERSFKIGRFVGQKGLEGGKFVGRKTYQGAEALVDRVETAVDKRGSKKIMTARQLNHWRE